MSEFYCPKCRTLRDKKTTPLTLVDGKYVCSVCAGEKPMKWISKPGSKKKAFIMFLIFMSGFILGHIS